MSANPAYFAEVGVPGNFQCFYVRRYTVLSMRADDAHKVIELNGALPLVPLDASAVLATMIQPVRFRHTGGITTYVEASRIKAFGCNGAALFVNTRVMEHTFTYAHASFAAVEVQRIIRNVNFAEQPYKAGEKYEDPGPFPESAWEELDEPDSPASTVLGEGAHMEEDVQSSTQSTAVPTPMHVGPRVTPVYRFLGARG